jgi:hypothetical protein
VLHSTPLRITDSTAALEHPHVDREIHLVGTPRRPVGSVRKAREAVSLIPPEPAVDRLARDAEAPCNLHDRDPSRITAGNRLIPLLHELSSTNMLGVCRGSGGAGVTDQAKPCHASAEART